MKEGLKKLLSKWKGRLPLPAVAVLAAGCLLLLIPGGEETPGERECSTMPEEEVVLEQFERRLEQALSRIAGAGETHVVLAVSSGSRQILAQDRKQDGDNASSQTVTVGSSGAQQVVPIQTVAPAFRGALVVCPGASDAQVRLEVTKAVCVLTGLGTDCVCVTTGIS